MTLLHALVQASAAVAATQSRNEKIALLADLIGRLEPGEVEAAVAFLCGELRQGRIGLGYAAVREVQAPAAAASPALGLLEVDRAFDAIAAMCGAGSAARRLRALGELLARATAGEQHFLRCLIVGELRQGALEGVMMDAIARAARVPGSDVRRATMLRGDLKAVARAALSEGQAGLARFTLELFRPLQPMLAQTADGVEDAVARMGRALLEWKLDGARIQVHRREGEVRVFSRQLNDVTAAVPEVVQAVLALPAGQIVLDGEAIALRPDASPLPFQLTMRRFGRRLDVERLRSEIPIVPFFFDCLHLDGRDLIDASAQERLGALAQALPPQLLVRRLVTADADEADAFLDEAMAAGHEGIMAKSLDAPYEAGRRGSGWMKIKPAHTLDLVVLAAEWGSGRRRPWLSNLHLGARDPSGSGFVMLGKTFKGLTDQMLAWQTRRFQDIEIARDDCTVYVKPVLVVEITFDGVQSSPHYPGGMALRFARVKRYRPDKPAEAADTIDTVRAIHAGRPAPR